MPFCDFFTGTNPECVVHSMVRRNVKENQMNANYSKKKTESTAGRCKLFGIVCHFYISWLLVVRHIRSSRLRWSGLKKKQKKLQFEGHNLRWAHAHFSIWCMPCAGHSYGCGVAPITEAGRRAQRG